MRTGKFLGLLKNKWIVKFKISLYSYLSRALSFAWYISHLGLSGNKLQFPNSNYPIEQLGLNEYSHRSDIQGRVPPLNPESPEAGPSYSFLTGQLNPKTNDFLIKISPFRKLGFRCLNIQKYCATFLDIGGLGQQCYESLYLLTML